MWLKRRRGGLHLYPFCYVRERLVFEIDHKTLLLIQLCIGLKTFIQATTCMYVLDTPVAYFTSGGQTRPMEQIARTTTPKEIHRSFFSFYC